MFHGIVLMLFQQLFLIAWKREILIPDPLKLTHATWLIRRSSMKGKGIKIMT